MKRAVQLDKGDTREKNIELLRGVPLFNCLDTLELSIIEEQLDIFALPKNKTLFKEGEKGDALYFVLDGCLVVLKKSENNTNVEVATLTKGRSLGEMSIVDRTPRSATIKAREESILATLSLEGFELLLNQYPKVGVKILKEILCYLSLNMRRTTKRLADSKETVKHIFKLSSII